MLSLKLKRTTPAFLISPSLDKLIAISPSLIRSSSRGRRHVGNPVAFLGTCAARQCSLQASRQEDGWESKCRSGFPVPVPLMMMMWHYLPRYWKACLTTLPYFLYLGSM
jgi:hypothetical protein